jgi:citrate synthase
MEDAAWITVTEAAQRLRVKPATLYAYVSRGVLRRRRSPDGRSSLFDPAEIEELAQRGRPRRPPSPAELVIESALTTFAHEEPFYRGIPVIALAAERAFEDVAALLWTGAFPERVDTAAQAGGDDGSAEPVGVGGGRHEARAAESLHWQAVATSVAAGIAAQSGLPPDTLPLERLQVVVPALAATDPLRLHLDPPAVIAAAQNLIAGMVDCLPTVSTTARARYAAGTGRPPAHERPPTRPGPAQHAPRGEIRSASIAARLWGRLCPIEPAPRLLDALRAALVLLADHELAASTLAARVAASVRADPYAVVATGLGAVSGALHGGASLGAEAMLAEVADPAQASRVIGDRLRRGERVPGLGHLVYRGGDPRGRFLLESLRDAVGSGGLGRSPAAERLAAAESVLAETRRRRLPEPNIDFALAALVGVCGMTKGSGEAIFAVARTAGWIAHALEEYAHGMPLRPRALYTGPPPAV